MRRYNQRLYRVARAIVKDEDEAEDVMQQAYIQAYLHLDQFSGRSQLATWLTRIAIHEALGRRRKRRDDQWPAGRDEDRMTPAITPDSPDPERLATPPRSARCSSRRSMRCPMHTARRCGCERTACHRRADCRNCRHGQSGGHRCREAGRVATDPDVKAFGKQMVTDHTGVNKQATELVTKLGVTPEDNTTARTLKSGGTENVAQLSTLQGAAFDKAYIAHEVAYHQQVLDALDKTLIPNASNEQLKALLLKVRPAFVAHLEHAKTLQGRLGS
jgi:RNA polymerase sigma factor (sigma-70 family)